jgi:hypothetical protein
VPGQRRDQKRPKLLAYTRTARQALNLSKQYFALHKKVPGIFSVAIM